MRQRVFVFDPERCFGCLGCVAACAAANRTPVGLLYREVLKLPPVQGRSDTRYLSLACNHCEKAPCVAACPNRALAKRADDGVVQHDPERCMGCRYCQMACPYGAIRWDCGRGVVAKCGFCRERLDAGREPACVETCFSGALRMELIDFGDEPAAHRKELPGFLHHPEVGPAIRFVDVGKPGREDGAT